MACVGGLAVGTNTLIGLYFFIALLVVFIFLLVLISPNVGILLIFVFLVLIDFFRRIISFYAGTWNALQLIAIDVVVIITLLSLYLSMLTKPTRFRLRELPSGFLLLLSIYVIWLIIEVFNPVYADGNLVVIGIRTYLWPIMVIVVGWYVADNWDLQHWKLAFQIVLITLSGTVLLGLFTFLNDPTTFGSEALQAILQPAEHSFRSWQQDSINLVSSVFASSKRFGRFLLMMYPLLWIYLDLTQRNRAKFAVFLICAVGCFVSGSREALFLVIVMYLLLQRGWSKLKGFVIIAVSFLLIVTLLVGPGEAQERFEFTLSTSSDWLARIQYMTITPVFQKIVLDPSVEDFFGIGAGRYGQGSLLYSFDPMFTEDRYNMFLNAPGLPDAGLYKVFVELGFIGLVIFLVFHIYVIALPWRLGIRNSYLRASAIALAIWFILFMKSHTVINDQIMTIAFWFYLGLITGVAYRHLQTAAVRISEQ